MKKLTGHWLFFGCFILLSVAILGGTASTEFLLDEPLPTRKADGAPREARKDTRKKSEFPPHIAFGIKAERIPNVKGAVRITWETDAAAVEDFIVGRAKEVPNTGEKALAALSIKVLPSGRVNSVIDSNLPPGQYYYVVLSKDRVMSREVDIYPDVNYTTTPVIIEKDIEYTPVSNYPDQVTLIHGQVINGNQVLLTWKAAESSGIVYTVYRGETPLNTPEKISRAGKIAVISDGRESYVDKTITVTGTYYYAVTTRDITGNEDLQLIPDQSYLTTGLYVALRSQAVVSNISAAAIDAGAVELKWKGIEGKSHSYVIYRYSRPISNIQLLALAGVVGTVASSTVRYIDRDPGPGSYYYAVLVKVKDSGVDNTLRERENYTVRPVVVERKPSAKVTRDIVEEKPAKEPPALPPTDNVDTVLKESFFPGHYELTIKRLHIIVSRSDNEVETAKARLFIGRALVELKRYREAIRYFEMPGVIKYFGKESRFWQDYAISKVR